MNIFATVECAHSVVILTTYRSGSTLLCEQLHRHGIGNGDEHILNFLDPSELDGFLAGVIPAEMRQRFELREFLTQGMLHETYCTKIMASYLRSFCQIVAAVEPVCSAMDEYVQLERLYGGSEFLFLFRSDKVAQAISRYVAGHTGISHRRSGPGSYANAAYVPEDYNHSVIFSLSGIHRELQLALKEEKKLLNLCRWMSARARTVCICFDGTRFFSGGPDNGRTLSLASRPISLPEEYAARSSHLAKTSTLYNRLLEIVYHGCIRRLEGRDPALMSRPDLIRITSAALEECSCLAPEWGRRQIQFIQSEQFV